MPHLFAEAFLVPAPDDGGLVELPVYDEKRAINLDRAGRPFVELVSTGETHTLTEVRGERDDRDREEEDVALGLGTITKVAGEGADRSDPLTFTGTDTRQLPGEREDRSREESLGARSGVPRESDDWLRADALLGTETAIGGEPSDRTAAGWADTQTFVRREGTDIAADW